MRRKPPQLHEFLCDLQPVWTEFKLSFDTKIHPIQASWTDCSFLNRWSVEVLKISKISEIGIQNINNFMSSCAILNLFRRNSSAHSILKFIPYKRLEQTAPSW